MKGSVESAAHGCPVHDSPVGPMLNPHEAWVIDLRKLRDAQKPDFREHTLPPDATDGSVHWIRFDGPVTGRLVVLQRNRGMASNYTCSGGCPCQPSFNSLHISPTSYDLVPGEQEPFTAQEWKKDCNDCYYYYDVLGGPWHSDDVSIATVTAGGGVVTGVSGGSTAIMLGPITRYVYNYVFHYPIWQCQAAVIHPQCGSTIHVKPKITSNSPTRGLIGATTSVTLYGAGFGGNPTVTAGTGITVTRGSFSATQIQASFAVASNAPSGNHSVVVTTAQGTSNSVNFYVQVPYSATFISQISATTLTQAQCAERGGPPGSVGYERWVTLELRDSASQAIQRSGVTVADQLNPGSPNGLGIQSGTTGTFGTDSTGRWPDQYFVCSTGCPGSGQSNVSQSWTANGIQLGHVNALIYTCSSISVDGN